MPVANGRDLLVKIIAVSVNPVDTKVRVRQKPEADEWRILGFDAAGVVGVKTRTDLSRRSCSANYNPIFV
jgi:NADPH:quinone reductase-like Zn-dependent oxidoreductase